jgi:hypothetical protein
MDLWCPNQSAQLGERGQEGGSGRSGPKQGENKVDGIAVGAAEIDRSG